MAAVPLDVVYQLAVFEGTPIPWKDASADGHTAPNREGKTSIWVENSGAELTVTIKSKRPSNFGTFPDREFTFPAGTTAGLPTFEPARFTDLNSGLMEITLSRVTAVRVAAIINQHIFKEE